FTEALLKAYKNLTPLTMPAWDDTAYVPKIKYGSFIAMTAPEVQAVVDRLDLYIAPLVNPDGRDFVLNAPTLPPAPVPVAVQKQHDHHVMWRKNRRSPPAAPWTTLAAVVASGVATTNLSVTPITRQLAAGGQPLLLTNGSDQQVLVTSAPIPLGAA